MHIEFLAKVNEDGTIFLPEEYRHLRSYLVKVQLIEQREKVKKIERGSPEALLECAGTWQFDIKEREKLEREIQIMRELDNE